MKKNIKTIITILLLLVQIPMQACYCLCGSNITQQVIVVQNNNNDDSEKTIRIKQNRKSNYDFSNDDQSICISSDDLVNMSLQNTPRLYNAKTDRALMQSRLHALRLSTIIDNEGLYENKQYSEIEALVINKAIQLKMYSTNLYSTHENNIRRNYGIYSNDDKELPEAITKQRNRIFKRSQKYK